MPGDAWTQMGAHEYETYWGPFDERFGFRPGMDPKTWPAIREPSPSITVDLSPIFDRGEPRFAAGARAVDAMGLYAWTDLTSPEDTLVVLDWQHPSYFFAPHRQAIEDDVWPVTIVPDGEYYAFLTRDFSMGTFGHPWEMSLCIFGAPLIERFGEPLASLLGVKRRHSEPRVHPSRKPFWRR